MAMDAELKAKWTAALRSGRYSQVRGTLRKSGEWGGEVVGFCCLGVLCDVLGGQWQDEDAIVNGELQSIYLDSGLLHDLRLSDRDQETLYTMNDDGTSFQAIADYIDANL